MMLQSLSYHLLLLILTLNSKETFEHLGTWIDDVKCSTGIDTVITIVGNKVDLKANREVSRDEGESFALRNGMLFCETSAVESAEIESLFDKSLTEVLHRMEQGKFNSSQQKRQSTASIRSRQQEQEKSSDCC